MKELKKKQKKKDERIKRQEEEKKKMEDKKRMENEKRFKKVTKRRQKILLQTEAYKREEFKIRHPDINLHY